MKCDQCGNQVLLGRHMSVCRECNVSVHTTCVGSVPRTCGLPSAFVKHYKDSLTKLNKENCEGQDKNEEKNVVNVEGWVKIPV